MVNIVTLAPTSAELCVLSAAGLADCHQTLSHQDVFLFTCNITERICQKFRLSLQEMNQKAAYKQEYVIR